MENRNSIPSNLGPNSSPPDHSSSNGQIGDFISEERAKEILGRGTTWFYYQRKDNRLRSYKLGSKSFYRLSDIEKLIEDGEQ